MNETSKIFKESLCQTTVLVILSEKVKMCIYIILFMTKYIYMYIFICKLLLNGRFLLKFLRTQ